MTDKQKAIFTQNFSGPLIFHYVWWVLYEAQKRRLDTLYFLARDGYILCEIAKLFCKKFNLLIECRYLYCSRASLRMPTYHFIGDEADNLLMAGGYRVTPTSLLKRVQLDHNERAKVYTDCCLTYPDEEKILNRFEREQLYTALKESSIFHKFVNEKSKSAYLPTIRYLQQEGLFEQSKIVLVDSGWTGSMQRSLRQLLQSADFSGELIGFYFGMYAAPKETSDGTYLTWLFDHIGPIKDKILFCNNLFECLLSAPHGMTVCYKNNGGKYIPVLLPCQKEQELLFIHQHIKNILEYSEIRLKQIDFFSFNPKQLKKDTHNRIARYMAHPTKEEVCYLGKYLFCDDVTEAYHFALANEEQVNILRSYSIPARVFRRLLRHPLNNSPSELFWPYGTVAFLPKWKQPWYRWNIYIWEWLRYVLQ